MNGLAMADDRGGRQSRALGSLERILSSALVTDRPDNAFYIDITHNRSQYSQAWRATSGGSVVFRAVERSRFSAWRGLLSEHRCQPSRNPVSDVA